MATPAQRRAYAAKLRQIARSFDRLERATVQQSIRLLRDVRNNLAGQLIDTEFSQFRIAEQQRALDDIMANYEDKARALSNGAVRQSFALGEQSVIEPLQAANVGAAFFRPSEAQVNVLAQFSADLISGVSSTMRGKINRVINMTALGGGSQLDAMREITQLLFKTSRPPSPRTRQPTKGVAYEAERILRTETNRAYNIASFGQQEKLAQDIPDLEKKWNATGDNRTRHSHLMAHGQIVPVGKPFIVGGAKLMYPLDPAGPPQETINCRCRPTTIIPEIGDIETPLDKQVEKERAKRVEDEKAKKKGPLAAAAAARDKATAAEEAPRKWYEKDGPQGQMQFGVRTFSSVQQHEAKREIVSILSEQTGIAYDRVDHVIAKWAGTSNDEDIRALHTQTMASELFNVPLSQFQKDKIKDLIGDHSISGMGILSDDETKRLLTAMYDNTQEQLAQAGIKSVRLYRGINVKRGGMLIGDTVSLDSNTIESWSLNQKIAGDFGDIGVSSEIPASDIIGSARTGFGCLNEYEFVIRGQHDATIWKSKWE